MQLHADDHARAIAAALPSPARAIVLARANAALSELVRTSSVARYDCVPGRAAVSGRAPVVSVG